MIFAVENKSMYNLTNIFGISINQLDAKGVLKRVDDFILDGKKHQISYVNAHCLNYAFIDKEYRNILLGSDLIYPDGMSVIWASCLYGNPLPERVNLGDFLDSLCNLCIEKNYSLFLLGGKEGVAEKSAERLIKDFPKLKIVGRHHGFFDANNGGDVIGHINNSGANVLLVGMGVPKQEKWIAQNKNILKPSVLWGVGALLDYYAGYTKRAPIWMRKIGLEWLFRLLVEPKRLWKRYIFGNFLFCIRIFFPILIELMLVAIAWLSAYWLRFSINNLFPQPIGEFKNYLLMLPLILISWPFIRNFAGIYSRKRWGHHMVGILADILKATTIGMLVVVIFSFIFREIGIARSFLIIWSLINLFLFLAWYRLLEKKNIIGNAPLNALIVGVNKESILLAKELENYSSEYKIVGFLKTPGLNDKQQERNENILGEIGELKDIVERNDIKEVIIANGDMPLSDKLNLVIKHSNLAVNFRVVSEELKPIAEKVKLSRIDGMPLLDVSYNKPNITYIIVKELADKILAVAGIIILFPLMCIIALIIKFDSPGPAIFIQRRVGKNGKNFTLYKFRTMFKDALPDEQSPLLGNDRRITCFGRLLRRWSLDELPQFINVIKGDMSIVGPRPEMPFIVKDYQPWQIERLKIKPGITGLWQVVGRKDIPLHRNIEYDFFYINNRSFMFDLAIMLKTIPAIISRRGAY